MKLVSDMEEPTVLNMLNLILDTANEESVLELADDCYNYLLGVDFKTFNYNDIINNSLKK